MAVGDLSFSIDPTKNETPQTVAAKRALAQAILGNTSHAPHDIGEGLNAIGQALMYRHLMKGVTGAETAGNSGASKVFQSLFGDQFPAAPAPSSPVTSDASTLSPVAANDHPVPKVDVGPSAAAAPTDLGAAKGDMTAFTNSMYQSGLNAGLSDTQARLMAAQAAHESGNGVHAPGNNFFGIKAGGSWDGDTQNLWTHEEVNGQNQKMQQAFRKYGTPEQAIQDRIAFMQKNFPDAFNATDINGAVAGLQHGRFGSYATDSNYAQKLQPYLAAINGGGNAPQVASLDLPGQAPIPQPNPMQQDAAAPVQVASNDPTAGMGMPYAPAAMPGGLGAIQQQLASQPPMDAKAAIARAMAGQGQSIPPEMGPQSAPAGPSGGDVVNAGLWPRGGQRVLDAMMQQQAMTGGAPMGMQAPAGGPPPPTAQPAPEPAPMPPQADAGGLAPQQIAQAAPPLPPPTTVQDHPIAPPQGPDMSQYPVIAGGTSDAVAPGSQQQGPSIEQLMQAAGNPWVMQKYGPVVDALLQQKMKQGDPSYALDLAKKRMDIQLEQQQLGGAFRGDSIDAQAWNILQTRAPSSKEYQTAYSIVSQPKTQMVQTANGLVPVQVPPQLPGWLKAPGDAGGPSTPPAGAALAPGSSPSGGPAAPGAPAPASPSGASAGTALPGTKPAPTEMQARNGAIGKILLNEVPTLGKTFSALADTKGQLISATLGKYGNPWQSEDYQRAAAAVSTSVANVLYSLSGASSNPGEVLKQIEVLTPAIGDKPGTITDKLNRFKSYVRSVSSEANDPELTKSVEDALKQMDMPAAPDAPAPGGPKNKTSSGVEWSISP